MATSAAAVMNVDACSSAETIGDFPKWLLSDP
jgi:hypothetical protein